MLSYERQNQIIALLREQKCATVEELSSALFASAATIRRDLAEMDKKGMITRVRGGAALVEGTNDDAPLLLRLSKEQGKKKSIARLALPFLQNVQTLFLDSSSTVTALAEELGKNKRLSVVTNGVATLNVLNENAAVKVFATGGLIKNNSSFVGPIAIHAVQQFHAEVFLCSCCGLSLLAGVTEASEDTTAIKQQMLQNAKRRILLCDSTKIGQEFFLKACDVQDMDMIITDQKPDSLFLSALKGKTEVIYP